jgi:shikimate dehydrogenase
MAKFALLGKSLKHSFSQEYFTDKFKRENLSHTYQNLEIENIDLLPDLLKVKDLKGFNVTIPYKTEIIPYLTEIDDVAKEIGAVNTVKVSIKNNSLHLKGYNTDVYGFEQSFIPFLTPNHKKALILGSGGASKAVAYILQKLAIPYLFVSRNDSFEMQTITYQQITESILNEYKIIVNTSPVGQYPNTELAPLLPYWLIDENNYFYDLIYNPEMTVFLKNGLEKGATIKNGLEMLHLQAEKAWQIFGNDIY